MIDAVENPKHQLILVKRYLGEKHWREIASETRISATQLYELHRAALEEVSEILKKT